MNDYFLTTNAILVDICCLALMVIVVLIIWIRWKLTGKNRALYRQILEHNRLRELLEIERKKKTVEQSAEETAQGSHSAQKQEDEPFRRLELLMREQRLFTDSELKRKDVAKQIGISDRALHDCIKSNTGMSFTDYINNLRLQYACELLLQDSKKRTIEAISHEAGFNTRMTFYRFLREKYGLTPEEFKKTKNKHPDNQ